MVKLFLTTLFVSFQALGLQVVEDFTTSSHWDQVNSTAVWNYALGYVHPILVFDSTTANGTDNEIRNIAIGNGLDGVFDRSTYSNFSVSGQVITINTNQYPVLMFKSFTLDAGWTLRGQGTNPLDIRVVGNFINNGIIDCSGGDGESITAAHNTAASGGTGRCGGAAGGTGGTTGVGGTIGANGAPGITGGGGGASGGAPGSGSGGGGNNSAGGAGGGAPGVTVDDDFFTNVISGLGGGGSGGGGGGAVDNNFRGGGGGGGGGIIHIAAGGYIRNSGQILAQGGDGGGGAGAFTAGGGGGAGGSIWLETPESIYTTGTIDADRGFGGIATVNGGNGALGRTWLIFGGDISQIVVGENPTISAGDWGEVHYTNVASVIQSLAYDTRSTNPTYTSISLTASLPGTSTATVMIAGSSDAFVSDDTGFVSSANISALNGKRYFKFKLFIDHSPAAPVVAPIPATLMVEAVTVNFDGYLQTQFEITPTCGYVGTIREFIFWFLLLGIFFIYHRMPKRIFKTGSIQND